jgi:hypothetical protein
LPVWFGFPRHSRPFSFIKQPYFLRREISGLEIGCVGKPQGGFGITHPGHSAGVTREAIEPSSAD